MQRFDQVLKDGGIPADQARKMREYAEVILETNKTFNLTRITDPEEMAHKHFLDSAAPIALGLIKPGQKVLDIGCGAGFPGSVLAIMGADVTMMDAQLKKVRFVEQTADSLGIAVKTMQGRAEEVARQAGHRQAYDVVVSRAVAALPMLMELCAGFCKVGGKFLAYKGAEAETEARQAENAAKVMGMKLVAIHDAAIAGQSHYILEYERVKPLKDDSPYPRAFGKIKKAPL
ncbi:MAG: 16S rRNA (guanine(527)-N(7))-methyltransferase RsmG [Christensenellaceae bacterium]|nr:16S rRNA (guanine(527)-N(7))-methyltransferase RsmG [Christensenellaceae bacterium]